MGPAAAIGLANASISLGKAMYNFADLIRQTGIDSANMFDAEITAKARNAQKFQVDVQAMSALESMYKVKTGGSAEDFNALLGSLRQQVDQAARGGEVNPAFAKLDIKLLNADGTGRNLVDILKDIADKSAGDSEKFAQYAHQLLGREMADFLAGYGEGFTKELNKEKDFHLSSEEITKKSEMLETRRQYQERRKAQTFKDEGKKLEDDSEAAQQRLADAEEALATGKTEQEVREARKRADAAKNPYPWKEYMPRKAERKRSPEPPTEAPPASDELPSIKDEAQPKPSEPPQLRPEDTREGLREYINEKAADTYKKAPELSWSLDDAYFHNAAPQLSLAQAALNPAQSSTVSTVINQNGPITIPTQCSDAAGLGRELQYLAQHIIDNCNTAVETV